MNMLTGYFRDLQRGTRSGWNRFWFSPTDPATLGLIRIFAGAMLFYTHLIWSLDLKAFMGQEGWVSPATIANLPGSSGYQWSYFYWIHSPALLWTVHIAALVVFALLTIGLFSRTMSVLAFLAAVSYANRASLAQFGLDDVNCMLALYLMVGPCGAAYSVDRWLKRRKAGGQLPIEPSIGANLAIRLLQVNLCVEYFFSGIGKAQGVTWWNGDAVLMVTGMYEYQSMDLTWMIRYRPFAELMAHVTVFWELSYCVLVWPRLLRPIVIAMGAAMHLGIGMFLGMWTFGLAMCIANLSFVSPWIVRRIIDRRSTTGGAEEGRGAQSASDLYSASSDRIKLPNGSRKGTVQAARATARR